CRRGQQKKAYQAARSQNRSHRNDSLWVEDAVLQKVRLPRQTRRHEIAKTRNPIAKGRLITSFVFSSFRVFVIHRRLPYAGRWVMLNQLPELSFNRASMP